MKWFWEQFAQSNIISGLLSLGIWGAIVYLAIVGLPIPDILYVGGTTVIAFFFGTKQGKVEGRLQVLRDFNTRRKHEENNEHSRN